jgi:hypothetical protein
MTCAYQLREACGSNRRENGLQNYLKWFSSVTCDARKLIELAPPRITMNRLSERGVEATSGWSTFVEGSSWLDWSWLIGALLRCATQIV